MKKVKLQFMVDPQFLANHTYIENPVQLKICELTKITEVWSFPYWVGLVCPIFIVSLYMAYREK